MNNEVNHASDPGDPLDALLRESAGYIPDDGFTMRVLKQLPPPRRRVSVRLILLSSATLLGSVLALWLFAKSGQEFVALLPNWTRWNWNVVMNFVPMLAVFGSLGWAFWSLVKDTA